MNRTAKAIVWTFVFLLMLLAADQFLLRVEFTQAQMRVVQGFYLDFRQRLVSLGHAPKPKSVEAVIDADKTASTSVPETPQRKATSSPRYLYVDAEGVLQFADSFEEIPPELRSGAQRLEE